MADNNTSFDGPDTPEAFLADRQRMWGGFTNATLYATIAMIALLAGMGLFLL